MNMEFLERHSKNTRRVMLFTSLLMALLALAAFFAKAEGDVDSTVAQVQKQILHRSELDRIYAQTSAAGVLRVPTKEEIQNIWVDQQVAALEAQTLGLQNRADVMRQLHAILYEALIETKLAQEISKLPLSSKEAETFYKSNPEIHLAHIFFPVPTGATDLEAQKILDRLKEVKKNFLEDQKMSFAEVAQRFSLAASSADGGSMGFRSSDEIDPALYSASRNLKPGEVVGPIRSQLGFHLLKVLAVKPWADADAQAVARRLLQVKKKALVDNYFSGLRKKYSAQLKPL